MARTELYEIQTWTPDQIQTKPMPEPCGSFQITIDRGREEGVCDEDQRSGEKLHLSRARHSRVDGAEDHHGSDRAG